MIKFKNRLKYFLECYFHQNEDFDRLDELIQEFKNTEKNLGKQLFISELHDIIENKKYKKANQIIEKYGRRELDDLEEVEKFVKFLLNRLIDNPTTTKAQDFEKKCKIVLCPVCSPTLELEKTFSLIEKATVIETKIEIYICKTCKLVWLDENDINANNAQDYKKFMKANGLKGLWKELKDVDIL